MKPLELKTVGDTKVVVTRQFPAPPEAVFRAHTEPRLLKKWMLGPEGWTMPVCICDPRPGGTMRFEWTDGKGNSFHLTGETIEIEPARRIVHVERMFLPDPTPDNHVETLFDPVAGGTLMTLTMTLPDAAIRQAMLASGTADGMEASYARLEGLLLGWT